MPSSICDEASEGANDETRLGEEAGTADAAPSPAPKAPIPPADEGTEPKLGDEACEAGADDSEAAESGCMGCMGCMGCNEGDVATADSGPGRCALVSGISLWLPRCRSDMARGCCGGRPPAEAVSAGEGENRAARAPPANSMPPGDLNPAAPEPSADVRCGAGEAGDGEGTRPSHTSASLSALSMEEWNEAGSGEAANEECCMLLLLDEKDASWESRAAPDGVGVATAAKEPRLRKGVSLAEDVAKKLPHIA